MFCLIIWKSLTADSSPSGDYVFSTSTVDTYFNSNLRLLFFVTLGTKFCSEFCAECLRLLVTHCDNWLNIQRDYVEMQNLTLSSVMTAFCFLVRKVLLHPLALQPTVGFGLSNNILPFFFFPICRQLSPSSHSQHLKIRQKSYFE